MGEILLSHAIAGVSMLGGNYCVKWSGQCLAQHFSTLHQTMGVEGESIKNKQWVIIGGRGCVDRRKMKHCKPSGLHIHPPDSSFNKTQIWTTKWSTPFRSVSQVCPMSSLLLLSSIQPPLNWLECRITDIKVTHWLHHRAVVLQEILE